MVERAPRRPATHPTARSPAWRGDERGQLLILTGVLLVLGFVIIGSTVVQLQSVEESTSRIQRDALLDPVDRLISNFNQTVRDSVLLGHTNTTDFQSVMLLVEDRIRDAATRSGLYISADLRPNPSTDIFWRDSRCGGYDPDYTQDGVIVGYEKQTGTETIAGAVYDLHITDGRQTIRMPYYVRIFQCMAKDTTVYVDTVASPLGAHSDDWVPARTIDGVASDVREEPYGTTLVAFTAAVNASAVTHLDWTNAGGIVTDGGGFAVHVGSNVNDYLRWNFTAPAGFEKTQVAKNLKLHMDHWHTPVVDNNDIVHVKVSYGGSPVRDWTLTPGVAEATQTITVGDSPSGNTFWTHAELRNAVWEYYIEEVGAKDVGRAYKVDYVRLGFDREDVLGHRVEATFDWPSIPPAYEDHTLTMRYRWDQKTAGEALKLEVWDYTNARWDTDAADTYTFVATGPTGWQDATFVLDPADHRGPSNAPRFRVTDSVATDALATDLDILYLDQLVLMSTVDT